MGRSAPSPTRCSGCCVSLLASGWVAPLCGTLRVVAFCRAPARVLWPSGLALVWFNSGRCPDALAALGADASLHVDAASFVAFRIVVVNP